MNQNNSSKRNQSVTEPQSEKSSLGKNEDVEFASEQADTADLEAILRANAADERQEQE